jgi:hypothetical protein
MLEQLTHGMGEDKTQPSSANVKVANPLEPDGLNLSIWMYDTYTCSVSKNCSEAFQGPMPGTKANAAAMNLLISSTPGEYHADITCFPSAYEAMLWICSKFRGGHNPAINNEWLRRFQQEGMTRTETLEQYVQRKVQLFTKPAC